MATTNLTAAEKQVETLRLRLEQAQNRLRQEKNKETAKQRQQDRKDRDRRLILTGAVIWNRAQGDKDFQADLMRWLDEGIPDNRNRVLFGLAQKPERSDSGQPINGGKGSTTLGE